MTLHRRKVDGGGVANWVEDGNQPMHVPAHAGWRIADGNADDIRVCGAHAWQSSHLIFANGHAYGTTACSQKPGIGDRLRRIINKQI